MILCVYYERNFLLFMTTESKKPLFEAVLITVHNLFQAALFVSLYFNILRMCSSQILESWSFKPLCLCVFIRLTQSNFCY